MGNLLEPSAAETERLLLLKDYLDETLEVIADILSRNNQGRRKKDVLNNKEVLENKLSGILAIVQYMEYVGDISKDTLVSNSVINACVNSTFLKYQNNEQLSEYLELIKGIKK